MLDYASTIKRWLEKIVSLVKILGAVDGTISIKTHLKGAFGLSGILDLAFLFIEAIWHNVQKGLDLFLAPNLPKH